MQGTETEVSEKSVPHAAQFRADGNWLANQRALQASQPGLPLSDTEGDFEWVFARDGSLTALMGERTWLAGCSLPRRAAEFMFGGMEVTGVTACFLCPAHATQIRVALDRLESNQAIIVVFPDSENLDLALHCENFSDDIAPGRLWFVAGSKWEQGLKNLLRSNPGLPTPSQFIRPVLADSEPVDRLIGPAQDVIGKISARRAALLHERAAGNVRRPARIERVCVVAPTRFRLWDDAGLALRDLRVDEAGFIVNEIDSDRPTSASPLALMEAASDSDVVLAPNLYRSSIPGVAPADIPWITWATNPRINSAEGCSPKDRLLLTDPHWRPIAEQNGWKPEQIEIAGWPPLADRTVEPTAGLTIIADTRVLTPPKHVAGFSSQLLLWEHIRAELTSDPFLLSDVTSYLKSRMERHRVDSAGLDATSFVDHLIVPAFQQGLVGVLLREGVPFQLFGAGWDDAGFGPHPAEPVRSRERLRQIVSTSALLLNVWPVASHPVEFAGRPVMRAFGMTLSRFLDTLRGTSRPARIDTPRAVLDAQLLSSLLRQF